MVEKKFLKNRIFMLKMSIIFVNTPSSMLFMMYQHTGRKNKPWSYTTIPQTAHKLHFWWYKKCKNSDFGIVSYLQEVFPPHSKCLILLIILLLVSKSNIEHGKPLFCIPGTQKNAKNRKKPYEKPGKTNFLIFGPIDVDGPGPYLGFLYSYIRSTFGISFNP